MHIYYISTLVANGFDLLLLLLSLWLCLRSSSPRYMRTFPVYCLLNCLVNFYVLPKLHNYWGALIGNTIDTCYFAFLLTQIIQGKRMILITWILLGVYLCFVGYYSFVRIEKLSVTPALFESCVLIVPGLYYYWEFFRNSEVLNWQGEASFWMVSGIVFYYVLMIPVLSYCTYFYYRVDKEMMYAIYSIGNFSGVVTYSLFIKGMSCKRKPSSSLLLS